MSSGESHNSPLGKYDRVSFVCPYCGMQAGWNEKRKVWDGVQVPNKENPTCLQYAHPRCAPKTAESIQSARERRAYS